MKNSENIKDNLIEGHLPSFHLKMSLLFSKHPGPANKYKNSMQEPLKTTAVMEWQNVTIVEENSFLNNTTNTGKTVSLSMENWTREK